MLGKLFKEKEMIVIGEPFEMEKRGQLARDRLRAQLSSLTKESYEIADAAHLGTAFLGTEGLSPSELLQATRRRFRAARGRGDDLPVNA